MFKIDRLWANLRPVLVILDKISGIFYCLDMKMMIFMYFEVCETKLAVSLFLGKLSFFLGKMDNLAKIPGFRVF